MNNFSELQLSALLSSNLSRNGFVQPTPVQAKSIPAALAGHDILATAQTGTGKTLAFLLPIVQNLLAAQPKKTGLQALILSPTRELAIQIHAAFEKLASGTGLRAAVIVGGLNERAQLRTVSGGANVAIATPGRLCDFLDRKLVKLGTVGMLVLDEADRMLDMGFLPGIKRILSELPGTRQTMFFSATIEASVAHLTKTHLKNPVRIEIGTSSTPAKDIQLDLYEVEQDRKSALLRTLLVEEKGSVLVFSRTKHGADRLTDALSRSGVNATRIHGDRTQNQRNQALRGFQTGQYRVLVATDIAARGIHVDGIAHVVNYDLPQVPEDFIHRVGRTGRAGAQGVASTFATRSQRGDISRIERALNVRLARKAMPDISAANNIIVFPATEAPVRETIARPSGSRPASRQGRPAPRNDRGNDRGTDRGSDRGGRPKAKWAGGRA